jgi:hypothetical protein
MNQVITDVPFGTGTIDAHMDTSSGELQMDTGHIDGADIKVTLDYETAKAVLVDGNMQIAMQAFMAGKIKAEGDLTKLMALQASGVSAVDPTAAELANRGQGGWRRGQRLGNTALHRVTPWPCNSMLLPPSTHEKDGMSLARTD